MKRMRSGKNEERRRGAVIFGKKTEVYDPQENFAVVKPVAAKLAMGQLIAYSEGIMPGRRTGDGHRGVDVKVFRLAANAQNPHTLQAFLAEQSRDGKPRSVLINNFDMARSLAVISDDSLELMREFWPGPLTLTMPRAKGMNIPSFTDSEKDSKVIGLQMPANSMITYLIKESGMPLVTASVYLPIDEKMGEAVAEKALIDSLYNKVNVLIRGATRFKSRKSTLLDMSGDVPKVLREGDISASMIANIVGDIEVAKTVFKRESRREKDLVTA